MKCYNGELIFLISQVIVGIHQLEKFQVRRLKLISKHIFASLMAYVQIQKIQWNNHYMNVYQWQKSLFRQIINSFIDGFILDKNYLLPQKWEKL